MPITVDEARTIANRLLPSVDAAAQESITDAQAQFFRDNGLLVIRNVLRGEELRRMQEETAQLVRQATDGAGDADFFYKAHEITGERTPFRVEYVIDKTTAGKALLGHPFILRAVEKLQGPNFIPTWDSMVFKQAGLGVAIPWHRDAGVAQTRESVAPIFNVDFYLDTADLSNCLWGILGSNRWTVAEADARIQALNTGGEFHTDTDCVPLVMNPGDVIFHNILVLHGSPAAQTNLRRVIYYEFRPAEIESEIGPHRPEYLPLKQNVLTRCLRHRAEDASYAAGETPFVYQPTAPFDTAAGTQTGELPTYRYPHPDYWKA